MPEEKESMLLYSVSNIDIKNFRKNSNYLYSPLKVRINPKTSHIVFPSFQPCITDAVKLTGIPKSAIINSATIRFISNAINSSCS